MRKIRKIASWKRWQKILSMFIRMHIAQRQGIRIALDCPDPITDILFANSEQNTFPIPRIIWMYWEQGEPPPFIQACIRRIRELHPDFAVHFLNRTTIQEKIPDIPASIWSLPIEQRSDWFRLQLLHHHGGIWLDAGCIVMKSMNWVLEIHDRLGTDFIGFRRSLATLDPHYPIIDNWFMAAPPGSRFIHEWVCEFNKPILKTGIRPYVDDIKVSPQGAAILQNIHDPYYLSMHVSGQVTLRKHQSGPIHLTEAESSAFLFQTRSGWNRTRLHTQLLLRQESPYCPPFIKLTAGDRRYLDTYIKYKLYLPESIVGHLMEAELLPCSTTV